MHPGFLFPCWYLILALSSVPTQSVRNAHLFFSFIILCSSKMCPLHIHCTVSLSFMFFCIVFLSPWMSLWDAQFCTVKERVFTSILWIPVCLAASSLTAHSMESLGLWVPQPSMLLQLPQLPKTEANHAEYQGGQQNIEPRDFHVPIPAAGTSIQHVTSTKSCGGTWESRLD